MEIEDEFRAFIANPPPKPNETKSLFDEFKEFVKREYGQEIKPTTDKSLAISFEEMFGCSFLDDEEIS